jgi:hypothetical protein
MDTELVILKKNILNNEAKFLVEPILKKKSLDKHSLLDLSKEYKLLLILEKGGKELNLDNNLSELYAFGFYKMKKDGVCYIANFELMKQLNKAEIKNIVNLVKNNSKCDVAIGVPINKINQNLIYMLGSMNFGEPFIQDGEMILTYHEKGIDDFLKIKYMIDEYFKGDLVPCKGVAFFNNNTVKFMKKLVFSKNLCDKESASKLLVEDAYQKNGRVVFEITNVKKDLERGKDDEIDVIDHRFSFHTHPTAAYAKFSTELGWPSQDDFISFADSFFYYGNIFHCIATVEGIYILSIAENVMESLIKSFEKRGEKFLEKQLIPFVEEKLNIDKQGFKKGKSFQYKDKTYSFRGPEDYIDYINTVCGIVNHPIYRVQFMSWEDAMTGKEFEFHFPKIEGNCHVPQSDYSNMLKKMFLDKRKKRKSHAFKHRYRTKENKNKLTKIESENL